MYRQVDSELFNASKFNYVIDVRHDIRAFMVKSASPEFIVDVFEMNSQDFNKNVFLYKQFLKHLSLADDRVQYFECLNEHGCYSHEKYVKVFNSRLKPGEESERIQYQPSGEAY